mmetsp:Transcript_10117/g.29061  ORF Transcript_10117/g.29061 Transcript_10117/m.29061 type:complete len:207 (+) Transcript_10117:3214-3834(+)
MRVDWWNSASAFRRPCISTESLCSCRAARSSPMCLSRVSPKPVVAWVELSILACRAVILSSIHSMSLSGSSPSSLSMTSLCCCFTSSLEDTAEISAQMLSSCSSFLSRASPFSSFTLVCSRRSSISCCSSSTFFSPAETFSRYLMAWSMWACRVSISSCITCTAWFCSFLSFCNASSALVYLVAEKMSSNFFFSTAPSSSGQLLSS